jgi:hypothetical protein
MSSENQKPKSVVDVNDWKACYNSGDDVIALSCTVSTINERATISGAGLILNNAAGRTVASFYAEFEGSKTAVVALNIPPGDISVGDSIMGVVSGEADGQHYFVEQNLTIANC